MQTLRSLRQSRALRLQDLPGGYRYNSDLENGKAMPGPRKLRQLAEILGLAVTDVWAACQASCANPTSQYSHQSAKPAKESA